jgi:hypothetical protein
VPTEINPFDDLYLTETASAREFTALFSDFMVEHMLTLFKPVNVVLKGTQGSGKTMLLSLLKPEIRLDFFDGERPFPVPKKLARFIGCGINFTRSAALDIGQRPLSQDLQHDLALFPLYFADFVNYWIVRDLLGSLKLMFGHEPAFGGIVNDSSAADAFARDLARQDCWFGYLNGVTTFDALFEKIDYRISRYRAFHQYNVELLDAEIQRTKTSIGEPAARAGECLRNTGVIADDVPIYVRIDQVEILARSDQLRDTLGAEYRKVINRALSTRDPRIFYRIGVRRHAWEDELAVIGSVPLEQSRNYRLLDIDDVLRRRENFPWIFPDFARDVFTRRLVHAGLKTQGSRTMRQYLGTPPEPQDAARAYAGRSTAERVLRIDAAWPEVWRKLLVDLFELDPLSAKLAEAWLRQTGGRKVKNRFLTSPPAKPFPWDAMIWRKERVKQALMQIAARCGQRLLWSGDESVTALSGDNILVCISICQHIWEAFFRGQRRKPESQRKDPLRDGIDAASQAIGIQLTSAYWYDKITEWPGGHERQKFVDTLGRLFQDRLSDDRAMSYPGHNGFSLSKEEFERDVSLKRFLDDAVNFGDLFEAPHTTKEKDRRQRIKWYLHPILSPHFRIPETHVKEPLYVTASEVRKWLREADVYMDNWVMEPLGAKMPEGKKGTEMNQLSLFDPLSWASHS